MPRGLATLVVLVVLAGGCLLDRAGVGDAAPSSHPAGEGGDTTAVSSTGGATVSAASTGGAGGMGGADPGLGGAGGVGGAGGEGPCDAYPPGAVAFEVEGQTHCYWLVTTPATQPVAQVACGTDAYLATVTSAEENAFVASLAAGSFPIWIGLRCEAVLAGNCKKSRYHWLTDEPFLFDGWAPTEPKKKRRGVRMQADARWYSADPEDLSYVCEAGPLVP